MDWILNILKSIFNNEGLVQKPMEKENPKGDLWAMTKKQLEEYGRSLGRELDRRHNKKKLIETLENHEKI